MTTRSYYRPEKFFVKDDFYVTLLPSACEASRGIESVSVIVYSYSALGKLHLLNITSGSSKRMPDE